MTIQNSTVADIPEIFRLYRLATGYQKVMFPGNLWPEFDPEMIRQEVDENRQFKILIDGQIACIWAIAFSDPVIWKNDDGASAIYIHRIATNPDFRGNNFVQLIADWAKSFARDQQRQYIRMDTCGHNERLISHYQKCGFDFLGMQELQNAEGLPAHYQDASVCYFEIDVKQGPAV